MKYTVSKNRKIYVEDRLAGELFYSQEFDDSVTPHDVGFQTVRERLEEQVQQEIERLTARQPEAPAEKEIGFIEEKPKPRPFTGKPVSKPERAVTVESVENAFPKELAELLYFEVTNSYILAKPRQYLGSDNFAKIAGIVRDQLGGEYVSAGKESHFRVKRSEVGPTPEHGNPPEFDPEVLMNWPWKGKKQDDGSYAEGTVSYGWDFADNFPDPVIEVLRKGPVGVGKYKFSLDRFRDIPLVHARSSR